MAGRINFGKIALVMFITVLIWVWADLALDEELPVSNATINVAQSNPKLWVTLNDAVSVSIEEIVLKGPLRRINELRREIEAQGALKFGFDAAQEGMAKSGTYTLSLVSLLQKKKQIRMLDLKVERCQPETLSVEVVELVKKSLTVKCFDESRVPVEAESIQPSKVDMFVPEHWKGEKLVALVQLSPREIEQARARAIKKTPYVELAPGNRRQASVAVQIKMPPQQDLRKNYIITTATLGFSLSANLQGKYRVKVDNLNEVIGRIAIKATPDAKLAYENMRYQVILEIDDQDAKAKESAREVVYNFPEEFVRRNEIVLNQPRAQARFQLVPISSSGTP